MTRTASHAETALFPLTSSTRTLSLRRIRSGPVRKLLKERKSLVSEVDACAYMA